MPRIPDFKLGATGHHPQGKVHESDEGEIRLAVVADTQHRIVRIHFGKPVSWLGLPVTEAKQFIDLIQQKIAEVEKGGN